MIGGYPPAPVEAADPLAQAAQWRRLNPRMLLIHPIREVGRAIPALVGIFFASSSSGHSWWSSLALIPILALSMLRWFTTRYRITPEQVQLRTGLFRRRTMATPADRVRTVDVTAHALHRLLGLARVAIGTGISDRKREGLVLDGLTAGAAGRLRAELLHRVDEAVPPVAAVPELPAEQPIARLDLGWLRYAPFTLSGAVTALAILGFAWRIIDQTQVNASQVSAVRSFTDHLRDTSVWLDVLELAAGLLLAVTVLSVLGYLLAFWNFQLTRHSGGSLHISRGLVTTRATSISEHRLRGVELTELLPLRMVGGARLLAVATGLRVGRGAERGGSLLLPACPLGEARRVGTAVLEERSGLIAVPLASHGRRALYRRLTRTLVPALAVLLAALALWGAGALPAGLASWAVLLPVPAGWLAWDRFRNLGHAHSGRYLCTQSGSLSRRRVLLQTEGIIGWNLHQSFFQRRGGIATLIATTAAGRQHYRVTDLDIEAALRLADAAVPGLLSAFLVTAPTAAQQ